MRAFLALTAAVLAAIGIGIGALSGLGSGDTAPGVRESDAVLSAAAGASCWSGSTQLIASPAVAHPGQVIALDVSGPNAGLLVGSNLTTFEAETPRGWAVTYYLGSPASSLGSVTGEADWTKYGVIPFSPHLAFAGVGTVGLVKVRVPNVPPGTYRVVRFNDASEPTRSGPLAQFPTHGANLCAPIHVLSTPPALRGANTIAASITPRTPLRDGERVHVKLRGFGDGGTVRLSECAFSDFASPLGCGPQLAAQPFVETDANGSATTTFVVRSSAPAEPGDRQPNIACSSNCVLVATLGSGYADVEVPLHFVQPGAAAGALEMSGGPYPGLPRPVFGTVSFVSASGERYSAKTAENGEYSVILPPGRYVATGESRQIEANGSPLVCRAPSAVVVGAGKTAIASIVCDVP